MHVRRRLRTVVIGACRLCNVWDRARGHVTKRKRIVYAEVTNDAYACEMDVVHSNHVERVCVKAEPLGKSREVAAQFAAELTRVAFAPLAKALGFYGDAAVSATAMAIARRETGGLTDELERIIGEAR